MLQRLRGLIRTRLARRLGAPDIPGALDRLRASGFRPRTVYDVGAYQGEFALECLARWPDAAVVCFEPQSARAGDLRALAERDRRIAFQPVLLGDTERDGVDIHLAETASSVLVEHHARFVSERVRLTTVDACGAPPPDLLKIDVQGYEAQVLVGAEQALTRCGAVLAEVNLLDIHRDATLVGPLTAWLGARGFVLYDVCGLHRRPLDAALWQADFLFVPETSPLRADKRWQA